MTAGETLENRLMRILEAYGHVRQDLVLVRNLSLPNGYIAAGYVRNLVWDHLHGYSLSTPLNDVDVVYYDPTDVQEEAEKEYERLLRKSFDGYRWSVKNQARMHVRNREVGYASVPDAMMRWPETATAVGVRLLDDERLEIAAPHGLDDLFDLAVRRSPFFHDVDYFYARIKNKGWLDRWPKLRIES